MRQVQISEELFTRLCAYHLMDRREPPAGADNKEPVAGKTGQDAST